MGKNYHTLLKKKKHLSNGSDGHIFQEMGPADITEIILMEGRGCSTKSKNSFEKKKMPWTWEEQSFIVGGSQKAKEDSQG